MAGGWTMGRSGWLVVLVLVSGFRTGLGDISVTMKSMVIGYKGKSVVIPCTYTTSSNEEIVKIEWEFKSQPVIYRDESEDHILRVKYRNRATISKSPAGNVALTLKKLDMDDRGQFKCKVTGRENSGRLITQEDITFLRVHRTIPVTEKPIDITEEDVSGKILNTITSDVIVSTAGEEPLTEDASNSDENNEEIITTESSYTATGATSVGDDSTIVNTKQPRRFHSGTIPVVPFTTNVMHNVPESEAIKGSGIFFYVLIIGLLCIIFVLILVIVLIARRKKRKSVIFNIPTMNQLALNLEERSFGGGGCQSSVDPASNDYESCFPVSQYESLPCPSNEYEQLLIKNPEGNDIHCEPSEQCAQSFKL